MASPSSRCTLAVGRLPSTIPTRPKNPPKRWSTAMSAAGPPTIDSGSAAQKWSRALDSSPILTTSSPSSASANSTCSVAAEIERSVSGNSSTTICRFLWAGESVTRVDLRPSDSITLRYIGVPASIAVITSTPTKRANIWGKSASRRRRNNSKPGHVQSNSASSDKCVRNVPTNTSRLTCPR